MKIEFLEPAYKEYQEAIKYYNLQNDGLGDRFIEEINRTISIISNYPELFSEYTVNTRKAVINIFPYNIIYSYKNDIITVIAIAHHHRKPDYWNE